MTEPITGTGRETSGVPVQWGAPQDHAACGDDIAAAGAAGAREALRAFAAEVEALNDWPKLESISDETAEYARGTTTGIAQMARRRAQDGQGESSGPFPVSQAALDGTEALRARVRDLEAALYDVLAHFTEHGHPGYEAVRTGWQPAERVKRWRVILHQPQREVAHFVTFTAGNYAVEHPLGCPSAPGSLCEPSAAVARVFGKGAPIAGRWRITGISEGLPDLERVES